jgi:protein-S-isoprenylcysteine O-methyltransferase Ste14
MTTPSIAPPCAAERTLRARTGAVLFRWRSWLPVPIVAALFLTRTEVVLSTVLLGAVIALAGSAMRAAGVAAAGTGTRRRSRRVDTLIDHGVFSWVRNPLYIGNFLLWLGVLVATRAWTVAPWALGAFALIYVFIVWYEEGVLESHFGASYVDYKTRVPRWLARPPATPKTGEHEWANAWGKEWHSAAAFGAITLAMLLKERIAA